MACPSDRGEVAGRDVVGVENRPVQPGKGAEAVMAPYQTPVSVAISSVVSPETTWCRLLRMLEAFLIFPVAVTG